MDTRNKLRTGYRVDFITVCGAVIGSYVWWRRPQNRLNADEYIQYKAMLIRYQINYPFAIYFILDYNFRQKYFLITLPKTYSSCLIH